MYQGKYVRNKGTAAAPGRPGTPSVPRQAAAVPAKKRGPRLGGVVFYAIFFLVILLVYAATYMVLLDLRDWLVRYEMAQPDLKSQEVFEEVFLDARWGELYDSVGIEGTTYESREIFVQYMEDTVSSDRLSYFETSAGLTGGKKYIVRLDDKKIATFTLKDHNTSTEAQSIPDWQLGEVELFIERKESVRVEKLSSHTVYVNGIALNDDHTIQMTSTVAAEYLTSGTTGMDRSVQELTGLMMVPSVKILDEHGAEMPVVYDEARGIFVEQAEQTADISSTERELCLEALKTYAKYMMNRAGTGEITKYYKNPSDAYKSITSTVRGWVQDAAQYEFTNETVTDYCRYSDTLFSARVSVTLNQYRSDDSVKESVIAQSMFFEKQNSGKWLCYAMTAVDVSEQVTKVRITFVNDGQVLSTGFFENTVSQINCPSVTPPEGKTLSGWVVEELDSSGRVVKNLVFQPDAEGIAHLPAGGTISAMTVYPLFE